MTFTINAEAMQPTTEPRVVKDTTQEASSEFKRTGYSVSLPLVNKGKDGDAQPINDPTTSILRFPIKIMGFEEDLINQ